jgi:hypothetical protein
LYSVCVPICRYNMNNISASSKHAVSITILFPTWWKMIVIKTFCILSFLSVVQIFPSIKFFLNARIIIDIWCFNLSHHLQASSSYHLHPICVNGFCTTTISLFLSCLKNCNNKQKFSFLEKIEIEMHIIKHMYLDYVHHRLLSIPNNSSDHHHLSLARTPTNISLTMCLAVTNLSISSTIRIFRNSFHIAT